MKVNDLKGSADESTAVIVGLGPWSYVLAEEASRAGFDVRGFVSSRTSVAADRRQVVPSISAAIEIWAPHVAIIATRPSRTAAVTLEALAHGLDVFAEKPIALSLLEVAAVADRTQQQMAATTVDYTLARQISSSIGAGWADLRSSGPHDVELWLPRRDHGDPRDPEWGVRWLPHLLSLAYGSSPPDRQPPGEISSFRWKSSQTTIRGLLPAGNVVSIRCDAEVESRQVLFDGAAPTEIMPRGRTSPIGLGLEEFQRRRASLPQLPNEIEGPGLEVSRHVSRALESWLRKGHS